MATATAEAAVIVKMCVVCREDCSGRPRVKDTAGRYVCKSCLDRIEQRRKAIDAAVAMSKSAKSDATVLVDGEVIKSALDGRSSRTQRATPKPATVQRQPARTPIPPSTRAGSGTPIHAPAVTPAKARPSVVTRPVTPRTGNPLTTVAARPIAHTNIELKPWAIKRPARSAWLMVGAMTLLTLAAAGVAIWVPGTAVMMLGALIAASVVTWVMLTFSACERGAWWGIGVFILPPIAMTFGIGFARDIRLRAATALVSAVWLGVAFWFIANRDTILGS